MVKNKKRTSHAGEVEPPATKYHAINSYREEDQNIDRMGAPNDASGLKPCGRPGADIPTMKTRNVPLNIGTWNVRTLAQKGKFDNLLLEMDSMKADILGLAETRWPGDGKLSKENHTIIYSGGEKHERGVAVVMKNRIAKSLMGYWPISDRIILCKFQAKPFNIVVLQLYAPTTDHSDEEIDTFYEEVDKALKQTKSTDNVIIMGDFNAKVGNTAMSRCMGKEGLGKTNERGERLIQFCEHHDVCIVNTMYKQPKRLLYTWKSPGDLHRNQIDYVLVKNRFKNAVITCKTYPGADIGSDHNPVIMKMKLKLKIPQSKRNRCLRFDVSQLKDGEIRTQYAVHTKNRFECLMTTTEVETATENTLTPQKNIDRHWENLKTAIKESNEKILPVLRKEAKQPWMTTEILDLMKDRKKHKGKPKYKELDELIRRKCKSAQEAWYNDKCSEIESLAKSNNHCRMYEKIKSFMTDKSASTGSCIKSESGDILFETDEILKRWTEYVEKLFDGKRDETYLHQFMQGPTILKAEVEAALNSMSKGKSSGIDNISTEMLQALGEFGIDTLTSICNKMYTNVYIPEDLKTSVFILLPKKQKAVECSDYRTISLMCHTLKLLLTVILRRISDKIDKEVGCEQAGFRKNSGTREAIFCLKVITEKYLEMGKELYACFIDYSKAFDTVNHEQLISTLSKTEVDDNDIALITHLYWQQITRIRNGPDLTEPVKIRRGVRQGCVLSPLMFNLYTEHIFRKTEHIPGVKINGQNINNLRYADDTVLIAEDEDGLQNLVTAVKEESEKCGLLMNIKKTKVMAITKDAKETKINVQIDRKDVEQVQSFTYLGQLITDDGRSECEIRRRIGVAKTAFSKKHRLLTNRNISLETRLRLVKCYVWSQLMYACETWTLSKQMEAKLEAFEMWSYRRTMKISWKEKKSNAEVLKMIGVKSTELVKTIKKKKLVYYGHTRRHQSLQKLVLEGKVEGKRGRGRRRKSWTTNVSEMTEMSLAQCSVNALNRSKWRSMVSNLYAEKEPR